MPFDAAYEYTPRERLLLIADALDDVRPSALNLGIWHQVHECGTVACALGWGILKHGEALEMTVDVNDLPKIRGQYLGEMEPSAWGALSKHLGISERMAADLFDGGGSGYGTQDPTPAMVAGKIRYVADHEMVKENQNAV